MFSKRKLYSHINLGIKKLFIFSYLFRSHNVWKNKQAIFIHRSSWTSCKNGKRCILGLVTCRNTSSAHDHVTCASASVALWVCKMSVKGWLHLEISLEKLFVLLVLTEHFTEGHFHSPRLILHHNAELLSSVWLKVTAWFQILSIVWWETARRPNITRRPSVTRSRSFTATRTTSKPRAFNCEPHGR